MTSPDAADAPAPLPALVPDGVACLRCGYSLKGLAPSTLCPECATPVERSLLGDLFRFSDPHYVRTLHRGALVVLIGFLLKVAFVLGFPLFMLAFRSAFSAARSLPEAAAAIVSLIGWWMLSTPDPARLTADRDVASRRILRAALLVQLFAVCAGLLQRLGGSAMAPALAAGGPATSIAFVGLTILISAVSTISWIVAFFTSLTYLSSLASRVPDARAMDAARSIRIMAIVAVAAGAFAGAAIYLLSGIAFVFGILIAGVAILALITAIRYLLLINRLRSKFGAVLATFA